jgi:hypothetical protein
MFACHMLFAVGKHSNKGTEINWIIIIIIIVISIIIAIR